MTESSYKTLEGKLLTWSNEMGVPCDNIVIHPYCDGGVWLEVKNLTKKIYNEIITNLFTSSIMSENKIWTRYNKNTGVNMHMHYKQLIMMLNNVQAQVNLYTWKNNDAHTIDLDIFY